MVGALGMDSKVLGTVDAESPQVWACMMATTLSGHSAEQSHLRRLEIAERMLICLCSVGFSWLGQP